MQKKIFISVFVALILVGGVVLVWSKKTAQEVAQNQVKDEVKTVDKNDVFVTNVDPDVSHWQTKETKYMVFKFPKEWYWVEATPPSSGYGRSSIITNNPNHSLQYPDIGMFDDITNTTEAVITDHGTATSNSGTPLDALDYLIEMAHEINPAAECVRPSDTKTLPLVASCIIKLENHQMNQNYYVIDEINSLIITARTTDDTLVPKDILEKIAHNIKIKY